MQSLEYSTKEPSEASTAAARISGRRRVWWWFSFASQRPWLLVSVLVASFALCFLVVGRESMSLAPPIELSQTNNEKNDVIIVDNDKSNAPSSPQPQSNDCDYDCQTDRLGHKMPLYTGQALCNDQYRFGLTLDGFFQWHDCDTNQKHIFYTPTSVSNQVSYFEMLEDATFQLVSNDKKVVWKEPSTSQIHYTAECLHDPQLDCPYLHLHKSGDVVMNSIDDNGKWVARNIKRCYENLF
jgi:hypothetical protein